MTKKSLLAVALVILFGRQADGLVLAGYEGSHLLACSVNMIRVNCRANQQCVTPIVSRYFNPVTREAVRAFDGDYRPLMNAQLGIIEIEFARPFEAQFVTRERTAGPATIRSRVDMIEESRRIADQQTPDEAHRFGDAVVLDSGTPRERAFQLDCNMMNVANVEQLSAEQVARLRGIGLVLGAIRVQNSR